MNTIVKINYGYNRVFVGAVAILTAKVRVTNNFPFGLLNGNFKVLDSKVQNNKVIYYTELDSSETRSELKKFTDLLLEYKLEEVKRKHTTHLQNGGGNSSVLIEEDLPW